MIAPALTIAPRQTPRNISGWMPYPHMPMKLRAPLRHEIFTVLAVGMLVFSMAPYHVGVIEDVRTEVWPALGADYTRADAEEPNRVYDCDREAMERYLSAHGFTRNPVAYLVESDGQYGTSWAYRNHRFAKYQTHVTLYEVNGNTHVYFHREWNIYRHPVRHHNNPGDPTPLDRSAGNVFDDALETEVAGQRLVADADCSRIDA